MRLLTLAAGEAVAWIEIALACMPGKLGLKLRGLWHRSRLKALGERPHFDRGFVLTGAERVSLGAHFSADVNSALHAHGGGSIAAGSRVNLNRNVLLDAAEGGVIVLGDDIMIGPNVVLRASNHEHADPSKPIRAQGHRPGKIVVEDGVWIAANAVLLPDVTVGAHSIVAAGAVVAKDVPPYSIVGGVPARVIRDRRKAAA